MSTNCAKRKSIFRLLISSRTSSSVLPVVATLGFSITAAMRVPPFFCRLPNRTKLYRLHCHRQREPVFHVQVEPGDALDPDQPLPQGVGGHVELSRGLRDVALVLEVGLERPEQFRAAPTL